MNPKCNAWNVFNGYTHRCNLQAGHVEYHYDSKYGPFSARKQGNYVYVVDEPVKTDEVVLELTLEELKGLVYALSGPEWKEDEPELVAKIDKALKEAL